MARKSGTKNITTFATAVASRCVHCGSTDREPYVNPTEIEVGGIDGNGHPYTHVVYRSTRCRACGQARRDQCHENRTSPS